jgi:hypothetical protein
MASLPKGWSRPIKASEVEAVFPMARTVIWGDGPLRSWQTGRRGIVVALSADPRSGQEQPVLKLCAVPSDARSAISRWVRSVVAVEAAAWWAEASRVETSLMMGLHREWDYDARRSDL